MKTLIRPWLGLSLLFLPYLCQAEAYALVIGVNAYPDPVGKDGKALTDEQGAPIHAEPLRGAVNDANSIRHLLVAKYGLSEQHVRELTDARANEQAFVAGIKWLYHSAAPGDQVVFYFSGHGGRIDDPKQPDGYEGVIALADQTGVLGSYFGELARALAERGINATFIFDSCYSGAMSRDASLKSKFQESPDNWVRAKKLSATGFQHPAAGTAPTDPQRAADPGTYAFLFASKRDQSASDWAGSSKVPAHGIFTLMLQHLIEADSNLSLTEMHDKCVLMLAQRKWEQVPNFEFSTPARSGRPLVWQ